MPRFIFIRHAKKLFNNGKPINGLPAHDPPLIEGQEKDIEEKLKNLKTLYGIPDYVYTSPYLRTRQTSQVVCNFYNHVPVSYEYNIREFLGWQKPKNSSAILDNITKVYMGGDLLGVEEPKDVEKRAKHFLNKFDKDDQKFYYVITHGIVISKVCKSFGFNKYKFEDFCGAYIDTTKEKPFVKFI